MISAGQQPAAPGSSSGGGTPPAATAAPDNNSEPGDRPEPVPDPGPDPNPEQAQDADPPQDSGPAADSGPDTNADSADHTGTADEHAAHAEPLPAPDITLAEPAREPEPDRSAERSPEGAEPPPADAGLPAAGELMGALTSLAALGSRVDDIAAAAAELARLRSRDTDLIARLHDDVTRLRTGEIAAALNPVVAGMIRLHDQMVSLGALTDTESPVAMLHTQLLQVMELTCAIRPFTPQAGDRFDASRHTGARRVPAADEHPDGTIARTIKAGFVRADGSIVRVAEVEVFRHPD